MSMKSLLEPAKASKATAAVIIVHGLGDSGAGWKFFSDIARRSPKFDHINFVFPNAPVIPITANSGYRMPGWFNIYQFGDPSAQQDVEGHFKSLAKIRSLIKEQETKYGIPPERVVLGGFSQGAALALDALATFDVKLAGFLIFSGFLPIEKEVDAKFNPANLDTPVFQGHGEADPIISVKYGKLAHDYFKSKGFKNYEFKTYPGLPHSTAEDELHRAYQLIERVLPAA